MASDEEPSSAVSDSGSDKTIVPANPIRDETVPTTGETHPTSSKTQPTPEETIPTPAEHIPPGSPPGFLQRFRARIQYTLGRLFPRGVNNRRVPPGHPILPRRRSIHWKRILTYLILFTILTLAAQVARLALHAVPRYLTDIGVLPSGPLDPPTPIHVPDLWLTDLSAHLGSHREPLEALELEMSRPGLLTLPRRLHKSHLIHHIEVAVATRIHWNSPRINVLRSTIRDQKFAYERAERAVRDYLRLGETVFDVRADALYELRLANTRAAVFEKVCAAVVERGGVVEEVQELELEGLDEKFAELIESRKPRPSWHYWPLINRFMAIPPASCLSDTELHVRKGYEVYVERMRDYTAAMRARVDEVEAAHDNIKYHEKNLWELANEIDIYEEHTQHDRDHGNIMAFIGYRTMPERLWYGKEAHFLLDEEVEQLRALPRVRDELMVVAKRARGVIVQSERALFEFYARDRSWGSMARSHVTMLRRLQDAEGRWRLVNEARKFGKWNRMRFTIEFAEWRYELRDQIFRAMGLDRLERFLDFLGDWADWVDGG